MPTKAQLKERLEELENVQDLLNDAREVEPHYTHIPYTWIDYPNGRIGIDVNGHIARIELFDGGQVLG